MPEPSGNQSQGAPWVASTGPQTRNDGSGSEKGMGAAPPRLPRSGAGAPASGRAPGIPRPPPTPARSLEDPRPPRERQRRTPLPRRRRSRPCFRSTRAGGRVRGVSGRRAVTAGCERTASRRRVPRGRGRFSFNPPPPHHHHPLCPVLLDFCSRKPRVSMATGVGGEGKGGGSTVP